MQGIVSIRGEKGEIIYPDYILFIIQGDPGRTLHHD